MASPVLISSPSKDWGEDLKLFLSGKKINCDLVQNGKDCQLEAYQNPKNFVILDIATSSNSSLEVIQYFRKSSPQTKIILVADSENHIKDLNSSVEDLMKLGAHFVLIKPFEHQDIFEKIDPVSGSIFKESVKDDEFKIFLQRMSALKHMDRSKSKLSDKLRAISGICQSYETLLRSETLRDKTITFSRETATLITDCFETESNFSSSLKELKSPETNNHCATFYGVIFSAIISRNLDWASRRTIEAIVQAVLLRDMGKILNDLPCGPGHEETPPEGLVEKYKLHTRKAVIFLEEFGQISETVKQIIYQRHEMVNGKGFPEGLQAQRIYPPVKILSLALHFSDFMLTQKFSSITALKAFMQNRHSLEKFDPAVIKGLITAFISNERKTEFSTGRK